MAEALEAVRKSSSGTSAGGGFDGLLREAGAAAKRAGAVDTGCGCRRLASLRSQVATGGSKPNSSRKRRLTCSALPGSSRTGPARTSRILAPVRVLGCGVEDASSRKGSGLIKGTRSVGVVAAMVGKRFSHLAVIGVVPVSGFGGWGRSFICRYDCGDTCRVRSVHLKSGRTLSCGCSRGRRLEARDGLTSPSRQDGRFGQEGWCGGR